MPWNAVRRFSEPIKRFGYRDCRTSDGQHVTGKLSYSKYIRGAVLGHNTLIGGAKTRVSKYSALASLEATSG